MHDNEYMANDFQKKINNTTSQATNKAIKRLAKELKGIDNQLKNLAKNKLDFKGIDNLDKKIRKTTERLKPQTNQAKLAVKEVTQNIQLLNAQGIKLGRGLDNINAKFGADSQQAERFTSAIQKSGIVQKQYQKTLASITKAKKIRAYYISYILIDMNTKKEF